MHVFDYITLGLSGFGGSAVGAVLGLWRGAVGGCAVSRLCVLLAATLPFRSLLAPGAG